MSTSPLLMLTNQTKRRPLFVHKCSYSNRHNMPMIIGMRN